MSKLSLVKKSVFLFTLGFLLSSSVFMVIAGSTSGDTYTWKVGKTEFRNSSTIVTDSVMVKGYGLIISSDAEPAGYLGARSNILDESYIIKVSGAWSYSDSTDYSHYGESLLRNPATGNYTVQGETRYYRNGGYTSQWAYITPFQVFPD